MNRILNRMAKIESRVDDPDKYLDTRWFNPNEDAEFEVDDIFDGQYELSYDTNPHFVDYQDIYEFDDYIKENDCKKVARR